jgi:alkylation response protein AidB-like acyl-CoA dehydrogenase
MDMSFSPEHVAFRKEVREGIRSAMPPPIRAKADVDGNFEMKEIMEWHKILFQKGWIAPHWPKQYGGPGWDSDFCRKS